MGIKLAIITFFFILFCCCQPTERQELIVDLKHRRIEILHPSAFVIDSVVVERLGRPVFSKALKFKSQGHSILSINKNEPGYFVHVDHLDSLGCQEKSLSLSVIIRRRGSPIRVTKELAMNFDHSNDIQVLNGIRFSPCANTIDTFKTDQRFR